MFYPRILSPKSELCKSYRSPNICEGVIGPSLNTCCKVKLVDLEKHLTTVGYNTRKHYLCPIRSQHSLDHLEMVWWESVPRGSSPHAWKLSSRLFSRPYWLPLGQRAWVFEGLHALIGYNFCPCWRCVLIMFLRQGTVMISAKSQERAIPGYKRNKSSVKT